MSLRASAAALITIALVAACAPGNTLLNEYEPVPVSPITMAPEPQPSEFASSETVSHGKYMVELLGCGGCHTDGALMGVPDQARSLAGSSIGIAHSNPLETKRPGVVFPPNLTPDLETGIGRRTDRALRAAISGRVGRHNIRILRVMPVAAYSKVKDEDIDAIIAYLRSIPPVPHATPRHVPAGQETSEAFVHFGVYQRRQR